MPMQTAFNDGAPEYGYWAPEEKGFFTYWDSEQRVRDGKAKKAAWNRMDPSKARQIRRARRKQMKAGNTPGLPAGAGRPRSVRMAGQALGQGRGLLGGRK